MISVFIVAIFYLSLLHPHTQPEQMEWKIVGMLGQAMQMLLLQLFNFLLCQLVPLPQLSSSF